MAAKAKGCSSAVNKSKLLQYDNQKLNSLFAFFCFPIRFSTGKKIYRQRYGSG